VPPQGDGTPSGAKLSSKSSELGTSSAGTVVTPNEGAPVEDGGPAAPVAVRAPRRGIVLLAVGAVAVLTVASFFALRKGPAPEAPPASLGADVARPPSPTIPPPPLDPVVASAPEPATTAAATTTAATTAATAADPTVAMGAKPQGGKGRPRVAHPKPVGQATKPATEPTGQAAKPAPKATGATPDFGY
jgi:hypothetical protein